MNLMRTIVLHVINKLVQRETKIVFQYFFLEFDIENDF